MMCALLLPVHHKLEVILVTTPWSQVLWFQNTSCTSNPLHFVFKNFPLLPPDTPLYGYVVHTAGGTNRCLRDKLFPTNSILLHVSNFTLRGYLRDLVQIAEVLNLYSWFVIQHSINAYY